MRDERLEKLARVLVDYSVEAGEGEQVLLAGGAPAEPLIIAVYARLLDGAIPIPQVALPGIQELFEHGEDPLPEDSTSRLRRLRGRRRPHLYHGTA